MWLLLCVNENLTVADGHIAQKLNPNISGFAFSMAMFTIKTR